MAAINDLQRANRCSISTEIVPPPDVPAIGFDKESRGYDLYFLRMAFGHLAEGLVAFRNLTQNPKAISIIQKWDGRKREVYDSLFAASDPQNKESFFKQGLSPIRSDVCFHYPLERFSAEIEQACSSDASRCYDFEIIAGTKFGEVYYKCADDVITNILFGKVNRDEETFKGVIRKIRDLQQELTEFVDTYIAEAEMFYQE
jgi:hypothetical protein